MEFGSCAVVLKEYAKAEDVLLRAYTTLGENEPSPSLMTERLERIGELYQAWGKHEEADDYLETLHDLAGGE